MMRPAPGRHEIPISGVLGGVVLMTVRIIIYLYIYIYYVIIGFDPYRYKYDIIMMFHCIPYAYMIQIPEVELNPWGLY
jgi:hypothetical protein